MIKIVGAIELENTQDFAAKNPIIPLKLSQFTRISESEYRDPMGGSVKQLLGGTAFNDLYNKIISEITKGKKIKLNKGVIL